LYGDEYFFVKQTHHFAAYVVYYCSCLPCVVRTFNLCMIRVQQVLLVQKEKKVTWVKLATKVQW